MIDPEHEESGDQRDRGRALHVGREDDDGDDQPGDSQQGHRVLRHLLDPIHELVTATRRLDPGYDLAPLLSLRALSSSRSCSSLSSRRMRSMEDGTFSGAAPAQQFSTRWSPAF